jgi:hypothetical protein
MSGTCSIVPVTKYHGSKILMLALAASSIGHTALLKIRSFIEYIPIDCVASSHCPNWEHISVRSIRDPCCVIAEE